MFKNYISKIFQNWVNENYQMVLNLVEKDSDAEFLDAGCGEGNFTKKIAKKIGTKHITGIEGLGGRAEGIKIIKGDLNEKLPFEKASFDVVVSHYSLEHLYNSGLFISETYRVLKKGGYTIVATDNLSAWANVVALFCGWQPFSTTMGVAKRALGNPFALRAGGMSNESEQSLYWRTMGKFSHNKVFAYQMLIDSYKEYGFDIEKVIGIGYIPFDGFLSKLLSKIDPRHSHLLILKARKK